MQHYTINFIYLSKHLKYSETIITNLETHCLLILLSAISPHMWVTAIQLFSNMTENYQIEDKTVNQKIMFQS